MPKAQPALAGVGFPANRNPPGFSDCGPSGDGLAWSTTASPMSSQSLLARLPESLLWDVDPESLDPDRHRRFLIRRIVERGDLCDVEAAWAHYGEAAFREALLDAPGLDAKTVAFFANQFGVAPERFRSHREPPVHWSR